MLEDRIEAEVDRRLCRGADPLRVAPGERGRHPLRDAVAAVAACTWPSWRCCGCGRAPFHVMVPSPPQAAPVPVRSTGATQALQQQQPVIAALAASQLVVDLTVEGLLHAPELPAILAARCPRADGQQRASRRRSSASCPDRR